MGLQRLLEREDFPPGLRGRLTEEDLQGLRTLLAGDESVDESGELRDLLVRLQRQEEREEREELREERREEREELREERREERETLREEREERRDGPTAAPGRPTAVPNPTLETGPPNQGGRPPRQ